MSPAEEREYREEMLKAAASIAEKSSEASRGGRLTEAMLLLETALQARRIGMNEA